MTTGIQKSYDARAAIVTQMLEITAAAAKEGRALTTEENEKWAKMEADERGLTQAIQAHEQSEKLAAEMAAKRFSEPTATGTPATWVSTPTDKGAEADYRQSFEQFYRRGAASLSPEQRSLLQKRGTSTQVVGTDALGGYLVPDLWQPEIERSMLDYSGIMQAARILRTSGGQVLYWPTEDDTTTKAVKVAEGAAFTVQDITFGQKQLDAYKYGTVAKVSWELLQDNAYNVEAEVRNTFSPRFGRILNQECTVGDGSGDPNGVVTASTLGKTTASATAITFAEVIDLKHSIDPAYRNSPNFGFMFNDTVLAYLKKLSIGSSDARPLWSPGWREGQPDTIDGTRYWINQDMDSTINTASKIMLCGDFSKYIVRIAQDMQVARRDELYSESGLVGFQAWMRFDGELINTAAVKHMLTA